MYAPMVSPSPTCSAPHHVGQLEEVDDSRGVGRHGRAGLLGRDEEGTALRGEEQQLQKEGGRA